MAKISPLRLTSIERVRNSRDVFSQALASDLQNIQQTVNSLDTAVSASTTPSTAATVPLVTEFPAPGSSVAFDGSIISLNGQLYRYAAGTVNQWQPLQAIGILLADSYANWTQVNYPPASYPVGMEFLITTWNVSYVVQKVGSVSAWVYRVGTYIAGSSVRPMNGFNSFPLGANDTGLQFTASDAQLTQYWTGSVWQSADGNVIPNAPVLASGASGQIIPALLPDGSIWLGGPSNAPVTVSMPASATVLATNASQEPVAATLPSGDIWLGNGSNLPAAVAVPASATLLGTNSSHAPIAAALPSGDLFVGSTGNLPVAQPMSGDATLASTGAVTLATVNASPGTFGDGNNVPVVTVNGKGLTPTVTTTPINFPTSLPPNGPAGGALGGSYPNPTLTGYPGFTGTLAAAITAGKNVVNGIIQP